MSAHLCFANMASPYRDGTISGSAMTNRNIDILNEKIFIELHKENHTALYKIDYYIKCDSSGMQVPLLFYAVNYQDNFNVWIDNKKVKVEDIPEGSSDVNRHPLQNFEETLKSSDWVQNLGQELEFKDIKYFEVELTEGDHHIHVEYTGQAMTYRGDWVNKYSYTYSLYPAKFWRSFNSLEIAIKILNGDTDLKTNLGNPMTGPLDSTAVWRFDKLPADEIKFSYIPQVNFLAKTLINVTPFGLTMLFFISMTVVHYRHIHKHRINNPDKKYSWVNIVGIIVVPLLTLIWFIWSFELIDTVIGEEASRYHGYTFLVIIFYPVVLLFYWYILRLVTSFLFAKRFINSVYNELNK
ncbi:MAG: hypothetical protein NVV82_28650 [Sporocytophaga sp.]|nr:hypothetical protein [Sporocytophaga sp.]